MKGILGRKLGMTQVFTIDGELIPVTVVEVKPNVVLQKKTNETDGYEAVQLGYEDVKEQRATKPAIGHAKKAGTAEITVDFEGKEDTCVIIVNNVKPTVQNTNAAYKQLNKYRKAKNRKALKRDKKLEKIALQRAKEMAETGKFSHTRPNGKSSLTLIKGNKAKGENIALGQKTCAQVSKAWYNSTGHRANMLRKNFTKVGIACYEYNGVTYWAQVFSS